MGSRTQIKANKAILQSGRNNPPAQLHHTGGLAIDSLRMQPDAAGVLANTELVGPWAATFFTNPYVSGQSG